MQDFNSWLWQKAEQDSGDVVCKFARTFMTGPKGLEWPVPVESLEDIITYIDRLNSTDDVKSGYKFAARVAWNDYQAETK